MVEHSADLMAVLRVAPMADSKVVRTADHSAGHLAVLMAFQMVG